MFHHSLIFNFLANRYAFSRLNLQTIEATLKFVEKFNLHDEYLIHFIEY